MEPSGIFEAPGVVALRQPPDPYAVEARRFVGEVLAPVAGAAESASAVPEHVHERLASLGYFGLRIPERYGGVGLTLTEYLGVVRELARTNLAFQELTEENNGIGSASLLLVGTEEQKARWLPRLASGEAIGAFALTEPGAGADAAGLTTTATPTAGGYLLNGTKHFITHGAEADLVTVVARIAGHRTGTAGITLFLVTPTTPGFVVARTQPMMGYRASRQAELLFDDAFVADDDVLGSPGQGFKIAMQTLDTGRLTVVADCLGAGEELLDRTLSTPRERCTFGRPLIAHGQVREMLGRSAAELLVVESRDARAGGQRRSRRAAQIRDRGAQVAGQRVRRPHRRSRHADPRRCRIHRRG